MCIYIEGFYNNNTQHFTFNKRVDWTLKVALHSEQTKGKKANKKKTHTPYPCLICIANKDTCLCALVRQVIKKKIYINREERAERSKFSLFLPCSFKMMQKYLTHELISFFSFFHFSFP